jgi:hypothetical protein
MFTEVLPGATTKLLVPSDSVAPMGATRPGPAKSMVSASV